MSQKLTKEMQDNILNYADEIATIEEFFLAVRQNVGQYLGYKGNKGFINMIREIFQNAVDEMMKHASPCDRIMVLYDERTHTTVISDNGRGIPFNNMVRIFYSPNTSSNYTKKKGEYSSGLHGVGSKVTNAVCYEFFVNSYNSILKEARRVEFHDGRPWDKGELKIDYPEGRQGTTVEFRPSYEVMGEITVTCREVHNLLLLLLSLMPPNGVIEFTGIDTTGTPVITDVLQNQDGILHDLINKTTNPLIAPIVISYDTGEMKADIALTYDSSDFMVEQITSYSNFCPTAGGTHTEGFIDGLCDYFRGYMNKIFLSSNSKVSIVNNDIKVGLKAIVAVAHLKPIFTGQAKEYLSNDDMKWFVKDLVKNSLEEWAKTNPNDLQKVCKYFKDVADLRLKADQAKVTITKKYKASVLTGLPSKYTPPNGKKNLECVIVEGDSAGGQAKMGRCPMRQGIFPIRGKIANAFANSLKKMLENEEVSGITNILNAGFGRTFDLSKCKYEKVVIMADGDVDGLHIRTLLLKLFLMYFRPMVLDGRIYAAVPPLYSMKGKGGKLTYFNDRLAYVSYIKNSFAKENVLCHVGTKEKFSNSDITNLLYMNENFKNELEVIAMNYGLEPILLESILQNRNLEMNKFEKAMKKQFKFMNITKMNGVTVVNSQINDRDNTAILNDRLITACEPLLKYVDNAPGFYNLNDNTLSLYELISEFDKFKPANIQRYKGLGEMNENELSESTLHPDGNRTLIRYTSDNIKAEIAEIEAIENEKSRLLKEAGDLADYDF